MNNRFYSIIFISVSLFMIAFIITISAGVPPLQSFIWNLLSSFDIIYYTLPLSFASNPYIFLASLLDVFVFVLIAIWLAGLIFNFIRGIDIERRITYRKIKQLNSHIIITPFNQLTDQILKAANERHIKCVVVTESEKTAQVLTKEGVLTVINEPSSVGTFYDAGITKAKFVIVSSESDVRNILISMAAKSANSSINIISRISDPNNTSHMNMVGAYKTVAPEEASGNEIANAVLKHIA